MLYRLGADAKRKFIRILAVEHGSELTNFGSQTFCEIALAVLNAPTPADPRPAAPNPVPPKPTERIVIVAIPPS